jgi:hypothetical protein
VSLYSSTTLCVYRTSTRLDTRTHARTLKVRDGHHRPHLYIPDADTGSGPRMPARNPLAQHSECNFRAGSLHTTGHAMMVYEADTGALCFAKTKLVSVSLGSAQTRKSRSSWHRAEQYTWLCSQMLVSRAHRFRYRRQRGTPLVGSVI